MNKAVFLDRDGTIIEDAGYLADPDGVRLLPGAGEALRELRGAGYLLVVVTNQSGIGRGFFSVDDMRRVNNRVEELFARQGVFFEDLLICPHAPEENCDCRKPSPKLLLDAAARHDIDLSRSVMVGDKISDVEAGAAAGCALNILLSSKYDSSNAISCSRARDMIEAALEILKL